MSLFSCLPCVQKFKRIFRGGSQPTLVEASDGLLYIVKFTNNVQGPNLLLNEAMGSEIYGFLRLLAPEWKPLRIDRCLIDAHPEFWIRGQHGRMRPDHGLCFGSRFLGGAAHRLYEMLPGSRFARISNREGFLLSWIIDVLALHGDNRQVVFAASNEDKPLLPYFIDHGHMFGGPTGEQRPHFLCSRYLDWRIYPQCTQEVVVNCVKAASELPAEYFWQRCMALPEQWKTPSALDEFQQFLNRMGKASLVRNVVDTLVDSIDRKRNSADKDSQGDRGSPVLRASLQSEPTERCAAV